jgi:hypothetical protein
MSLTKHLEDRESPVRAFFAARLTDPAGKRTLQGQAAAAQPSAPVAAPPADADARQPRPPLGAAADHRLRLLLAPIPDRPLPSLPKAGVAIRRRIAARHGGPAAGDAFDAAVAAFADRLGARLARLHASADIADGEEDALCRACHVLAWLELAYRAPYAASLLDQAVPTPPAEGLEALVDARDATDTARVAAAARTALLPALPPGPVTPGPTFPLSADVGGADGDVVVGGLLLDVKTTAGGSRQRRDGAQTLLRRTLWQLAGYALLDAGEHYGLKQVGVYLARQATLVRWPLGQFLTVLAGEPVGYRQLRAEFEKVLEAMWEGQRPSQGHVQTTVRVAG